MALAPVSPEVNIWQIVLTSAVVSALVGGLISLVAEWFRPRRAKIAHFEELILGRKIGECERLWRLVGMLVTEMAPISNDFLSLEPPSPAETDEWRIQYYNAIQSKLSELDLAFEQNAIVLGPPIMFVWQRYSGELNFLRREAEAGKLGENHTWELVRWCKEFPADLAEAIEKSIRKPQAVLSYKRARLIRNEAMDAIKNRIAKSGDP